MPAEIDVGVVTQDPGFGGGARAQTEAFCRAVEELGRVPRLLHLARGDARTPFPAAAYRSLLPQLDALDQLSTLRMLPRARAARSLWVVAAAAHYGLAAAASGTPYACWIGTGLEDEWASRRAGLPRSRRLALRANAPVLRRLEREVLRRAARVYATSPASRESVAAAGGLEPEQVGILPIPVALDRFAPEPDDTWRRRLEAPVLVFVGRAGDPRKNLPLLLDAFRRVRARLPRARLRLVGEPPDRAVLTGLDGAVEVLGDVPSVAEALRSSTLLVLPSRQEGFGIVVAEALASGVPAIVTRSGGPERLVADSGGGVVLDGFDPDELADRAVALLGDSERLLELRRRGREHVSREHAPARLRELVAAALAELDRE